MTTTVATICAAEDCERDAAPAMRGWCTRHYAAARRNGEITIRPCYRTTSRVCASQGCDRPVFSRNMCSRHYQQWWGSPMNDRRTP